MKKLIVCLMVLAFGGFASADALSSASAVWQFGDWSDDNGPPYSDWDNIPPGALDATAGVDVSADNIPALNSDGLAAQHSGYNWAELGSDMVPILDSGYSMFIRLKFDTDGGFFAVSDGATGTSGILMGMNSWGDGVPEFGMGNPDGSGVNWADVGPFAMTQGSWYDITGVWEPGSIGDNSGTLTMYVYDPMTGGQLATNSATLGWDNLNPGYAVETDLFVYPNNAGGTPGADTLVELAGIWNGTALSSSEVAGLSAVPEPATMLLLGLGGLLLRRKR